MSRCGLLIACSALVAACSVGEAPLLASDVVVYAPKPGMHMSAGYLTLTSNGREAITITRVTSPEFESVELHESKLEDGISRMVKLSEVQIPAGGSVKFEPGGKHLMLMGFRGTSDRATLQFHAGETLVLTATTTVTR